MKQDNIEVSMKRFLYYDEDSINSFLAQIEQGLTTQRTDEEETGERVNDSSVVTSDISGDLSAKILGLGASIDGNVGGSHSVEIIDSRFVRGVKEKILHDYAFDRIIEYLCGKNQLVEQPGKIGDIVFTKTDATFLDFGYVQKLFSKDGAMDYYYNQNMEKAQRDIEVLRDLLVKNEQVPGDDSKKAELSFKIIQSEENIKKSASSVREMSQLLKLFRDIVPYERSILARNLFIPCDDDRFRDDPSIVAFKYGGEMTVFGCVTNIITSDLNRTVHPNNSFADYYATINRVMLSLFKEKDTVYILNPIAIYYDS